MRFDHVGIVVDDLEAAIGFYESLGLVAYAIHEEIEEHYPEDSAPHRFRACAMLEHREDKFHLWLMEPIGTEGPLARYLADNGPGLHHLGLTSEGVREQAERLKGVGTRMVRELHSHPGMGVTAGFIHPRHSQGVLVELAQWEAEPE